MSGRFIQKRREDLGLSQRQFAEQNGINFRTLQDYEQGRKPVNSIKGDVLLRISNGLGCSIEEILLEEEYNHGDAGRLARLHEYYSRISSINLYGIYYKFPVIVDNTQLDLSRVHPLKQKLVSEINSTFSANEDIATIMLFGSSITMRCNPHSDIDLAIRLNDNSILDNIKNQISEEVQELCNWNADILWFDRLKKGDRIYHDICRGVQIV